MVGQTTDDYWLVHPKTKRVGRFKSTDGNIISMVKERPTKDKLLPLEINWLMG